MSGEPELLFRCKGCGSYDSIVEISLVPRVMGVRPIGDGHYDHDDGRDEAFWEAESVIGYGCDNDATCEFWQGQYGLNHSAEKGWWVDDAPSLEAIAEVVEDTGVNPEAGNPAFYYPVQ